MRILLLSPRQCQPPVTGAKLREYYLARALACRAELTHIFFRQADTPDGNGYPLQAEQAAVEPPRRYTPAQLLQGAFGRWPLPVVNYTSAGMAAAIEAALRRSRFDLVQMDSIHMTAYAEMIRSRSAAPIIYDWHNIESKLMRQYSGTAASRARRAYALHTARRMEALERRILREGFGHVVCSEREEAELRRIAPDARIAVVANGVDCGAFDAPAAPVPDRRRLVFVGSMDYHANVEAAVWFTRTVWPRTRAQLPGFALTIVGANPAPAVLELRGAPGVEVTGTVADVRPYYRDAAAAIVPLRTGGGTRLKILEAMAAGVPVISTTLGAEGLAVKPEQNILIADSAEAWSAQLAEVVRMGDTWRRLSAEGRALARSRYDWDILGTALYETYRRWLEDRKR